MILSTSHTHVCDLWRPNYVQCKELCTRFKGWSWFIQTMHQTYVQLYPYSSNIDTTMWRIHKIIQKCGFSFAAFWIKVSIRQCWPCCRPTFALTSKILPTLFLKKLLCVKKDFLHMRETRIFFHLSTVFTIWKNLFLYCSYHYKNSNKVSAVISSIPRGCESSVY